jgi:hypothetical protein
LSCSTSELRRVPVVASLARSGCPCRTRLTARSTLSSSCLSRSRRRVPASPLLKSLLRSAPPRSVRHLGAQLLCNVVVVVVTTATKARHTPLRLRPNAQIPLLVTAAVRPAVSLFKVQQSRRLPHNAPAALCLRLECHPCLRRPTGLSAWATEASCSL